MKTLALLASTVALIAVAAHAEPGKGHKGGPNNAQGPGQAGQKAPGPGKRDAHKPASRGQDNGPGPVSRSKPDKGPRDVPGRQAGIDRGPPDNRGADASRPGKSDKVDRADKPGKSDKADRAERPDRFEVRHRVIRTAGFTVPGRGRGLIDGCPPGLAKKNNGCMPPGQAKRSGWHSARWYGYRSSDRYRFLDGNMVRLGDNGRVLGYEPLLGGALGIGSVWPMAQTRYALPDYYRNYYNLGQASSYRTYGNAIYRVNPQTSAITSVAALLTGNNIAVGRPMPYGYDAYNVPLAHRSLYADGPTALHRYSDGYVYQLDPTTRVVQAAIELLS